MINFKLIRHALILEIRELLSKNQINDAKVVYGE